MKCLPHLIPFGGALQEVGMVEELDGLAVLKMNTVGRKIRELIRSLNNVPGFPGLDIARKEVDLIGQMAL